MKIEAEALEEDEDSKAAAPAAPLRIQRRRDMGHWRAQLVINIPAKNILLSSSRRLGLLLHRPRRVSLIIIIGMALGLT